MASYDVASSVYQTLGVGGDGGGGGAAGEQEQEWEDAEAPRMLTCDEWVARNGLAAGPMMDGHFGGWVAAPLCTELGLASSAAAAWEANGGVGPARRGRYSSKCVANDWS